MSRAKKRSTVGVAIALPLIVLAIIIGVRPNRGRAHSAAAPVCDCMVTNLNDSGDGSLRQAIINANANSGADTITFQDELSGTITLTSGELLITDDLNINGPGTFVITVSGNNASRVFDVSEAVTATISGLTISNGKDSTQGGGILNGGTSLSLNNLVISGNSVGAGGMGGGIFNNEGSSLTINNCTLSGNTTGANGQGGGIFNNAGTFSPVAPAVTGTSLTITGTTLSGNSATNGGGIFNGGTIQVAAPIKGQLVSSTVTITNCTLSGNSATANGGGIFNLASNIAPVAPTVVDPNTANISFTTLSGNSAGVTGSGIFNSATVNIKNSIVANSMAAGDCANTGTWNSTGKNFNTSGSCPDSMHFMQVPSTGPGGLNLGPLADNGGPTQTHALLPGSVAIDAAPDCTDVFGTPGRPVAPKDVVTTDQRGVSRPQGSACDVGAYEFVPCTTQPSITCPEDSQVPTDANKCTAKVDYTPAQATCPCANQSTKPTVPKQNDTCTVSCTPPPGSTFNKGPNTVTCTVTDAFGNTNQCSFTITVVDQQPPTVNCPQNITKNTDPGKCSTTATYTATATDNCDVSVTPTCNPPSGSTFQKGTTTVTCMATDSSGNTGSCTFTVTVVDNEKPQFPNGCPNDVTSVGTASCPINTTGNVANFATPAATDNCPGPVTVACVPPSGSVFPTGTTTVTCTATDASGNTATCTFSVAAFSFCLQDETNPGNFDLISATTGDYSFFCNGVQIASGRGTLNVKGCQGSIEHQKGDRRVFMEWDTVGAGGKGAGTAIVQLGVNNTKCQITDKNMSNNTCAAPQQGAAPVSRKLGKPQN